MFALEFPMAVARRSVEQRVRRIFEADRFPEEQYTDPPGDPGLFGPGSVTWRVHAHPSMIVGGLSAIMLQALHPLAMAGVADHSNYQEAPFERLARTSSFVGATTFASTVVAEEIIDIVKAVHARVVGVAPDGRPYAAGDPALLRWVHVAEVGGFMHAHRRYHPFPVRGAGIDRYFAEVAVVAERLGATEVPRSRAEIRTYFNDIRPELVASDDAREVMRFVSRPMGKDPVTRAASQVLIEAAVDLMPGWARELYGIRRPPAFDVAAVRPAAMALLTTMRLVMGPSPAKVKAEARCAAAS